MKGKKKKVKTNNKKKKNNNKKKKDWRTVAHFLSLQQNQKEKEKQQNQNQNKEGLGDVRRLFGPPHLNLNLTKQQQKTPPKKQKTSLLSKNAFLTLPNMFLKPKTLEKTL